MGLDKIWEHEAGRVMEVLGGEPQKYKRKVEDKLMLQFTVEQWQQFFNVAEGYRACNSQYVAYALDQPIQIFFVRTVTEE